MTEKKEKVMGVVLKGAILNFVHVYEEDENGKFSACLMLPKDGKYTADNLAKISEVADSMGVDVDDLMRDGDDSDFSSLHGYWLVNAKSKYQPKMKIIEQAIYNGITAHVKVTPYEWTFKKREGISWGLSAIKVIEETPCIDIDIFESDEWED